MLKIRALALPLIATVGLAACDSGTTTAAPDSAASKSGQAKNAMAAMNWTEAVVQTPEGGFRMGNPEAKVKIIEFASFTCSHCRDFHNEAVKLLKPDYIATGKISYEYRPFMLNVYDFAAAMMAMCQGPERFFTWANELYANHDAWVQPLTKIGPAEIAPLQKLPPDQQIRGLAEVGRMHEFARVRGLPKAQLDACLTNQATLEKLTRMQQAAVDNYQISATPSFVLNGKKLEGVNSWSQLQPKIAEAL